jgi:CTP:molybdopterin cytidylyltransferase MocA
MSPIIAHRPARARDTAVLVLAAGASRRLGRPKQLVRLDGEPLVRRTVRVAESLRPLWIGVVVGASAARVAAALRGADVEVVLARRWREGLAASLAAGVRRAPPRARQLLVMTVDQWRLQSSDLARLLAAAGRCPAAAVYGGRLGVPAVFPRRLWPALRRLRGDRGARELLERGPAVPVPMPAAAADLDTPAELASLKAGRGACG